MIGKKEEKSKKKKKRYQVELGVNREEERAIMVQVDC
jgi:hypothetical protein